MVMQMRQKNVLLTTFTIVYNKKKVKFKNADQK